MINKNQHRHDLREIWLHFLASLFAGACHQAVWSHVMLATTAKLRQKKYGEHKGVNDILDTLCLKTKLWITIKPLIIGFSNKIDLGLNKQTSDITSTREKDVLSFPYFQLFKPDKKKIKFSNCLKTAIIGSYLRSVNTKICWGIKLRNSHNSGWDLISTLSDHHLLFR